jgi:hypothetical protein
MERLGVHHFDMSGSTRPIQQAQLKTQALDGRETRMQRAYVASPAYKKCVGLNSPEPYTKGSGG